MDNQRIYHNTKTPPTGQPSTDPLRADLISEQVRLVQRLTEITAQLAAQNNVSISGPSSVQPSFPKDFDLQAYAIGIIWRNPNISTRELAKKIGVSHAAFHCPGWADVARILKARKSAKYINVKDSTDEEEL